MAYCYTISQSSLRLLEPTSVYLQHVPSLLKSIVQEKETNKQKNWRKKKKGRRGKDDRKRREGRELGRERKVQGPVGNVVQSRASY